MKHHTARSSWLPRAVSLLTLGLLVGACGGPSGSTATDTYTSGANTTPSAATPNGSTPAATTPATGTGSNPAAAPAVDPSTGAVTGGGTGTGGMTGSTFSWTKPAGFDAALQAAISSQPSFMGGYGGQIPNPFPQMPGTVEFPSLQITRPDAITLGQYFGRWAYRFYVDENSRHSNGLRAEFTGVGDYTYVAGDVARYEFSMYFDDAYQNSSWTDWNMFAQFHSPDFAAWGLHTAGGYLIMSPPGAGSDAFRIPMPARNQWHAFSWTIRWSGGSDGRATLLIDGQTAFDYSGPTMHDGEPYYYAKFGSYLANNPYTQVTYETPWVITRL